jgi:glycosyltransferase involved in cell wall biosynthesis
VEFVGQVSGEEKERLLASADLLVAPSHSESFGMSIAEALARGVPVLTTTATPWSVLNDFGCGWQVEPTTGGITSGLRRATIEDRPALALMGARGLDYVRRHLQWDQLAGRYLELYEEAIRARAF